MSRHDLLIGFEPFGSHYVNPSELPTRVLADRAVGGRVVTDRIPPVETRSVGERLGVARRSMHLPPIDAMATCPRRHPPGLRELER